VQKPMKEWKLKPLVGNSQSRRRSNLDAAGLLTTPSEVVTDPLDTSFEKVTLISVKGNAVALEYLTNALEVEKDGTLVSAPKEVVIG
jgi:uncharacterized protein YdeI (YjbR/CyaY-like superfamily)